MKERCEKHDQHLTGPTRRVSVLWSFMCGIIAILSRPSTRAVPEASALVDLLDRAVADQTIAIAVETSSPNSSGQRMDLLSK